MTLQIGNKIDEVIQRILGDPANDIEPDITLANDIARDGLEAIFAGLGPFENGVFTTVTEEWKGLMRHFAAENSRELVRLCGQDRDFNRAEWGRHCLAYIAGDSVCTSETTMETGVKRSMLLVDQIANQLGKPPRRMLEILDAEDEDLERIDMEVRAAEAASRELDTKAQNSGNIDSSTIDTSNDRNK